MRLINFASGSKGNSTLISVGDTHLLIDCGISFRRLRQGLESAGVPLASIGAVVLTHLHSDHAAGLPVWYRGSGMRFLAPEPVVRHSARIAGATAQDGRFSPLRVGESVRIGDINLDVFPVSHDAPETVGLRFAGNGKRLVYMTDLGTVSDELPSLLEEQDLVFIEANHEPDLVASSSYPERTKRRILSPRGHLSNQQALSLLSELVHPPSCVVFGHLSENNNSPAIVAQRADEFGLSARVERVATASQCAPTSIEL